ncbi:MAG TPA: reverse transcriptase-like protein [Candidatus Saccharimonadales bacterium]|nr:reverse transcriptase-like protein [Candidatus Saccharimonadales bacterium]
MKQLKFNHKLAELIRRGKKTATFRMYDDKDLSVNDTVELLDKVITDKPATWVPIGEVRIDSVIEKRLSDLSEEDLERYEGFKSRDQMLRQYKEYYGDRVTLDTPIKVIHFTMLPLQELSAANAAESMSLKEVNLYTDGGSRGNPGPSASGYAIMDLSGRILVKKGVYLGITTNNQAEYLALKLGLEETQKMHVRRVHVYMDSLLVVNQMLGVFKIRNRDLWPIHDSLKEMIKSFDKVSFTHVPRSMNKIADAAVNEALDAAARGL